MRQVLDRYGVQYGYRLGWQAVRCPNRMVHDDQHPSAGVNLTEGAFVCHTCGLKGDAFAVLMELEGIDFPTALRELGQDGKGPAEEPMWVTWN
jgi:DNA primase